MDKKMRAAAKTIKKDSLREEMVCSARSIKSWLCLKCRWKKAAASEEKKAMCADCVFHREVDHLVRVTTECAINEFADKVKAEVAARKEKKHG